MDVFCTAAGAVWWLWSGRVRGCWFESNVQQLAHRLSMVVPAAVGYLLRSSDAVTWTSQCPCHILGRVLEWSICHWVGPLHRPKFPDPAGSGYGTWMGHVCVVRV